MLDFFASDTLGWVRIRALSAKDWIEYIGGVSESDYDMAWLLARCLVDEHGARLFRDEDATRLNALSAGIVSRIGHAILRHSGMDREDRRDERAAFRKETGERFARRLARDFRRSDFDAFLSAMPATEYQRWEWSYQADPPIEEHVRTLTRLMAQLIADQRNIHRGKDSPAVSASDFVPPEPTEESDEAMESGVSEVAAARDAHEGLRAGLGLAEGHAPLMPLLPRPGATPVPPDIFARMTGGSAQSDRD